ncbi:metallophosphoesterase [Prolixibacteraceae bacterium Z1-6]|uniref:Metallophosphoesterase n=1 Tax=Draconibacterium aestuarii TaxID=2998507 RepID=A0A9X3F4J1_9BACT|nr:metallophosphoesterase [Prolixibacteraceae bacterium Z1-6]
MKTKSYLLAFVSMIFLIVSCTEMDLLPEPESDLVLKSSSSKLKVAVITDIHYMDHSLLPENPEENADFQYLLFTSYNKMIELSEPIFLKTVSELKNEKPDVLLVTGDLAFNGEKVNHEIVKTKLQELSNAGTQVLVIPGNNDINSPDAKLYEGTGSTPISNITPEEFATIYGDFGYNEALYKDDHSLSYIFKLRDDLWILGIDACIYAPTNERNGEININTLSWIQEKMAEANENGITVLAMMHFGIGEHYKDQRILLPTDLVNNFDIVSTSLMEAGIRFVFTGHSHANDIVELNANGNSMYDIETGSLITPLSPYRIVTLNDNFIKIETKRITSIDSKAMPKGESFIVYSDSYLVEHLDLFFSWYLVYGFKLPSSMAEAYLPYLRNSMMAQFAGDEQLLPPEERKIEELKEMFPENPVESIIKNLWNDLPPADDKLYLKIK